MNNSKSDGGRRSFEEFDVKFGLRPLLFIALLYLISRKTVVKDAMKKLLYADDWPWWRMANRSYRKYWRFGPVCLPDTG